MFKQPLTAALIFCTTFANLHAKTKSISLLEKKFFLLKITPLNHVQSFKLNNLLKLGHGVERPLKESYLKITHWFRRLSAQQPLRQKLFPVWVGTIALSAGVGVLCIKLSKKTESNTSGTQPEFDGSTGDPECRASNTQPEFDGPTADPECRALNTQPEFDGPTANPECRASNAQPEFDGPTANPEYSASNTNFSQSSENTVLDEKRRFFIQKINNDPLAALALCDNDPNRADIIINFFENKPSLETILKFYTEQLDSFSMSPNWPSCGEIGLVAFKQLNFYRELYSELGTETCSIMTTLVYYGYKLSKIDKELCAGFTKILLEKSSSLGLLVQTKSERKKGFAEDPYSPCPFYCAAHGAWKYLFDIAIDNEILQHDISIKNRLTVCAWAAEGLSSKLKKSLEERKNNMALESSRRKEIGSFHKDLLKILKPFRTSLHAALSKK